MLKLLLVVALFALATYVVVRLLERRGRRSAPRGRGGSRPPEPRPLGPDDDPDFLRDLDRRRRHPEHPEDPEL
ncbi:hypothetical protein QWY28_02240 [Nocardioides sp. SOB77]|uniref:Uncharacterized protein n=1 Tax=Nocardioides oceani TaxID=3058369 RepID=A0ABT8FBI0_9ACTN|nr:hypothetical protein [Nocardioides oceani]MDN4171752.1 hypothetical protein [Nocardioides oceani]